MKNRLVQNALFIILVIATLSYEGSSSYYEGGYEGGGEDYQDYADGGYQEDNLYANYEMGKEKKLAGDGGWGKPLAFGCVGWFLGGKIHSKRAVAKANKKHTESQKQLYSQYYKDVLLLQTQNAELEQHLQEYQKHHLDGEFEAADLNDDDRVSRAEFNAYKARYLKKHPEMADQFPSFESFDPDRNGFITKEEHDDFYKTL